MHSPPELVLRNAQRRLAGGFTTIELLVVMGIILALVALLIPAMGGVRKRGRDKQADSYLAGISSAIEMYHNTFGAYPGPVPLQVTASTSATPGTKVSGAQNLALALGYAITGNATGTVQIPGSAPPLYVDALKPEGPVKRESSTATIEQLKPFYNISNKVISPANGKQAGFTLPEYPAGGFLGSAPGGNGFKFPVLVDTYQDPLPVLYYRRVPGIDFPAAGKEVAGATPPPIAAYILQENIEYTTGKLENASGREAYDQSAKPLTVENLRDAVVIPGVDPLTAKAHGGYLLMSAGEDRLYGETEDNRVLVGGH